jgi:hypothetical protein
MRGRIVLVAALVLVPALVFAQKKNKKASVPAVFGNARYVFVQAEDGDIYNPHLMPEDRQAISDVQNALRDWGRYALTPDQDGAELVFIVRKGRAADAKLGGTVGTPSPGPYPGNPRQTGPGVTVGGGVGPPDDFLEIRMRDHDGNLSGPIWEHSLMDGLNGPRVPLVQILRDAVERDYPQK